MTSSTHVHPRPAFDPPLQQPSRTAAALGYRMPAEWTAQACVWVSRPFNEETWPGCLDKAQTQWDAWIDRLRLYTPVSRVNDLGVTTADSWVRDFGPIFVCRTGAEGEASTLALHDFGFDSWGGKYDPAERDDVVPQHIAARLRVPVWVHDFVLEGGSIDVNGRGTLLTTEQCLLQAGRNPDVTREDIERRLAEAFGVTHVVWLPGGIEGDDTDGHVDDVARFINATTAVVVVAREGHPDHAMTRRNHEALRGATDQDGRPIDVVELPTPEPVWFDYPGDRWTPPRRHVLPMSYANFLMSNGAIFVPVFGQRSDDRVLRLFEELVPGWSVEPVRAEWLVVGQGTVHCLSMQQPAGELRKA